MSGSECPTYQGDYFKILTKATMSYLQNIFLIQEQLITLLSRGEEQVKHAETCYYERTKALWCPGKNMQKGRKGKGVKERGDVS